MITMMIYSYQPDHNVKLDEDCQNTKTLSRPHYQTSIIYKVEQWLSNQTLLIQIYRMECTWHCDPV